MIENIGTFDIHYRAAEIRFSPDTGGPMDPGTMEQALLGPPLIMLMAAWGTFQMHTSAAYCANLGLAAFCAESGSGKSTLVGAHPFGWIPVVDDQLPVRSTKGGIQALPHFPQLKWPRERQYRPEAPQNLELRALFQLRPKPAQERGTGISIERLDRTAATLTWLRHGVSTRLFPPHLLRAHLRFCASAAEQIPVYQLYYSKRREILPDLWQRITEVMCRG